MSTPPGFTNDFPGSGFQFQELAERVAVLEKSQKKSRTATIIAGTAFVISLLSSAVTLYDSLHKSPRTSVVKGSGFELVYNPKTQVLTTKFNFGLQNLGNADDAISAASAVISDKPSNSLAPLSEIKCASDRSSERPPTFTVPKAATTAMTCSASTVLKSLSLQAFSTAGPKLFQVDMTRGSGGDLNWSSCFELDPNTVNDIKKSKNSVSRQFRFESCK
jgi:hypothetical protein